MFGTVWIGVLVAGVGAFDLRTGSYGRSGHEVHDLSSGSYGHSGHESRDLTRDSYGHSGHDWSDRHDSYGKDWGYNFENGPSTWKTKYPRCDGYRQSPVALPSKPDRVVKAKCASYKNFDIPQPATLRITDNGVEINLKGKNTPVMWGVYKNEKTRYRIYKMVIHWGKKSTQGSEHSIDGEKFAGELQVVKFNEKYKSPEEAFGKPGGILVYSFLFKATKKGDYHRDFDIFAQPMKESSLTKKPVDFVIEPSSWVLGIKDYYLYEGSLTMPPCSEKVLHIVIKKPRIISEKYLDELRKLTSPRGQDICDNFRPIQPLNKRKVILVKERSEDSDHMDEYETGHVDRHGDMDSRENHWFGDMDSRPNHWDNRYSHKEDGRYSQHHYGEIEDVRHGNRGAYESYDRLDRYMPEDDYYGNSGNVYESFDRRDRFKY